MTIIWPSPDPYPLIPNPNQVPTRVSMQHSGHPSITSQCLMLVILLWSLKVKSSLFPMHDLCSVQLMSEASRESDTRWRPVRAGARVGEEKSEVCYGAVRWAQSVTPHHSLTPSPGRGWDLILRWLRPGAFTPLHQTITHSTHTQSVSHWTLGRPGTRRTHFSEFVQISIVLAR